MSPKCVSWRRTWEPLDSHVFFFLPNILNINCFALHLVNLHFKNVVKCDILHYCNYGQFFFYRNVHLKICLLILYFCDVLQMVNCFPQKSISTEDSILLQNSNRTVSVSIYSVISWYIVQCVYLLFLDAKRTNKRWYASRWDSPSKISR